MREQELKSLLSCPPINLFVKRKINLLSWIEREIERNEERDTERDSKLNRETILWS